jgi:hypothetical protein
MGTETSFNDEWIELYNNTSSPIDISNWKLVAEDGTPEIALSGVISPKDFYLLERTDDTTISEINADKIYTGALGNKGEKLKLFDEQGNLIDEVNCSTGWFEGDNSTKQTMERKNSLLTADIDNWQTSQKAGGTPKINNGLSSPQAKTLSASDETIKSSSKENQENEDKIKDNLAFTGFRRVEDNLSAWRLLLIALFFAIFSGITILMIKKLIFSQKSDKLY